VSEAPDTQRRTRTGGFGALTIVVSGLKSKFAVSSSAAAVEIQVK
jgi:hypothetical protein